METDLYSGLQSVLAPAGPQADRIYALWWLFAVVSVVVWLGVAAALGLALWRRGRQPLAGPPRGEPGKVRAVAAATALTVATLFILVTASVLAGRPMGMPPAAALKPLVVEVIGHQWWWEIRYRDDVENRGFTTANELRVPTGRPVVVRAISRDVIHSFWVPNLVGKIDLVPGKINAIWFQADVAGEYRGQCAEFCGLQHAKMAFLVIADEPAAYEAWAERQRQPAAEPADPLLARGRDVFLGAQCSLCHTIRGTGAYGRVAPDLTHAGSRRTLAAGTLRNTRGNLGGWIVDPQHVKPGNFMPPTNLAAGDLQALLAYLESLQ